MWQQQQQQQLAIANHSTRLFWANIWRQWRWQRLKTANQVHRYRYPSNPPPPPVIHRPSDPWPTTPDLWPLSAPRSPWDCHHRRIIESSWRLTAAARTTTTPPTDAEATALLPTSTPTTTHAHLMTFRRMSAVRALKPTINQAGTFCN